MHIVIDDRERRSGILAALTDFPDLEVSVDHLSVGDYHVENRFFVERKRLDDLVASIADGRLFSQISRLSRSLHPVLILEGTSKLIQNSHMSRAAIQGALIHVSLFYGVPILRSRNVEETAALLHTMGHQITSSSCASLHRSGKIPKSINKQKLFMLQRLPGVGPHKAIELLKHFGSIGKVMTATIDELRMAPGIGPLGAERIHKMISES